MSDVANAPAAPADAPAAPAAAPATIAGGAPPAAAPAAPAAAPASAPATLAGGAPPPPAQIQVTTTWPEDWRDRLAGDDKAFRARLDRFTDPSAIAKSYRELESKVSSGELKAPPKPLPVNATTEQVTAWRAEQGLPTDAAAMISGLQLPNGVVPGEADQPLLTNFAEWATAANWTQDQYNQAVGWYYGLQEHLVGERQTMDSDYHNESMYNLQSEWGRDFQKNQNILKGFWDRYFPKEVGEKWLMSRGPDGTIIGDDPGFTKAMLEIAKVINPVGTALPNVPGATLANADQRIGEIEQKYMRAPQGSEEWKAYWKNPTLQAEYLQLLEARETMRSRGAA